MAIGLPTVPSGCFGESIRRGGAYMFEPARPSTTSSSKIIERLRCAVGRCAGLNRSPPPRPPLRGLSSRTGYASGSLSANPRIDGSPSSFVASGTRRSWSDQHARSEPCTHSPSATLNSRPAFATQPSAKRDPRARRRTWLTYTPSKNSPRARPSHSMSPSARSHQLVNPIGRVWNSYPLSVPTSRPFLHALQSNPKPRLQPCEGF